MAGLEFEKVDKMTPAEERAFMRDLTKALANDDPGIADGMVCEYPDGRREVVRLEDDGTITVLRGL